MEGWSIEEAIKLCTYYLGINQIGVPMSRHEGWLHGKGRLGKGQYVLRLMHSGELISLSSMTCGA